MSDRAERRPPAWLARGLNALVGGILRSPVHRLLSRKVMVIEVTGRRTGRRYRTPVSRIDDGGSLVVFTRTRWWRNLVPEAPVAVVLDGRRRVGAARATDDPAAVQATARRVLGTGRATPRMLGLPPHANDVDDATLGTMLHGYAVVAIVLDQPR